MFRGLFKNFSWIIFSIALYFVGLAFYIFNDETEFWTDYFYALHLGVTILGLAFNFKKNKTDKEMAVIAFFMVERILVWLKFVIVGMILELTHFMGASLDFFIILGVSAFVGIMLWFKKEKHENV